jgi:hypothetical protein
VMTTLKSHGTVRPNSRPQPIEDRLSPVRWRYRRQPARQFQIAAGPRSSVRYVASPRKPLQTTGYKHLPRPGAVIGDQVATDGVLAWRLGYVFVHYTPQLHRVPLEPRLMRQVGRPIRSLLFRTA